MLTQHIIGCAINGDIEAIQEWFATGTRDPDDVDYSESETLLTYAAEENHCDVIRLLLGFGASVDIIESKIGGRTSLPLNNAALSGHHDAVALLLDHGAKIEARDEIGHTSLMSAAWEGHLDLVRFLLSKGADLDARLGLDDAESFARADRRPKTAALLAEVRAAGGWKAFVRAPRVRLLALRYFCEEGKAEPPAGTILERLFLPKARPMDCKRQTRAAKKSTRLHRTALPKEVFWHIITFWRSERDYVYDPAACEPEKRGKGPPRI